MVCLSCCSLPCQNLLHMAQYCELCISLRRETSRVHANTSSSPVKIALTAACWLSTPRSSISLCRRETRHSHDAEPRTSQADGTETEAGTYNRWLSAIPLMASGLNRPSGVVSALMTKRTALSYMQSTSVMKRLAASRCLSVMRGTPERKMVWYSSQNTR